LRTCFVPGVMLDASIYKERRKKANRKRQRVVLRSRIKPTEDK